MFMLTGIREILKAVRMQNPFAENSEEVRESFKQMETLKSLKFSKEALRW